MLSWALLLVGLMFGVAGGVINLAVVLDLAGFLVVSPPVAVVGLGFGWYLINRVREDSEILC